MENSPDARAEAERFERARASVAAALRRGARVVELDTPPGFETGRLLHESVRDAGGCLVVTSGGALDLDGLASRILERLGAPSLPAPAGVLRAYAAHLRSRGRRLVFGIASPWDLPAGTVAELGGLLRSPGNGIQLVVGSGGPAFWAALGVEPKRVTVAADPRAGAGPSVPHEAGLRPAATSAAMHTDPPPRGRRWQLGLTLGGGLAAALTGLLVATQWPVEGPPAESVLSRTVALSVASSIESEAPGVVAVPWPRDPVTPSARPAETSRESRVEARDGGARPGELDDPVSTGRRALAALARARSEAEWQEGTRILHEIGPQPALVQALDELGAQPGCVRKRRCPSARGRLEAALCTAWADAIERGAAPAGLSCS